MCFRTCNIILVSASFVCPKFKDLIIQLAKYLFKNVLIESGESFLSTLTHTHLCEYKLFSFSDFQYNFSKLLICIPL